MREKEIGREIGDGREIGGREIGDSHRIKNLHHWKDQRGGRGPAPAGQNRLTRTLS